MYFGDVLLLHLDWPMHAGVLRQRCLCR